MFFVDVVFFFEIGMVVMFFFMCDMDFFFGVVVFFRRVLIFLFGRLFLGKIDFEFLFGFDLFSLGVVVLVG